jgi:C4-dicarboxylate-binding protein DctP
VPAHRNGRRDAPVDVDQQQFRRKGATMKLSVIRQHGRSRLVQLMFGVALGLGAALAQAADPVVVRFSHVVAPDTPKGRAALRFKEVVEKRTNGAVKVEVYPSSTLFKDGEEMDALVSGKVDIIAPSLSKFSGLGISDFEVFDLPYIFPSRGMLRRVTDGPIGKELLRKLEPKGVTGLAFWDNGFKIMSANTPLRKPADFKGLKLRIQSSQVIDTQMRTLGAQPMPMAFSEVFDALKSGKVDGTENPPSNLYSRKMHEVQKHVTVSNHGYLGYAVIANKKFWDSLPATARVHLKIAMLDATRYANLYAEEENNQALAKVRAAGTSEVYTLSADEREAWRRALMPVHAAMESHVGKALIQAIYEEGRALGHKF